MYRTTRIAIELAEKSGKLLNKLIHAKLRVRNPEPEWPMSIITNADDEVEVFITRSIHRYFPSHDFYSPTLYTSADQIKQKHLWIIDPIDGTKAFINGLPHYAVSISYFVDQEPVSSALYLASTNEVLWAETKKGAFIGRKRIHVVDKPVEQSMVALDPSNRKRKIAMKKLAPGLSLKVRFLTMTSGGGANLGLVARGNLQGLVFCYPDVTDFAAGLHLVKEANGIITDFRGKPYPWFTESGHIAATKSVLPYILQYTRKAAKYFME